MSFILDALKKSEIDRQRQAVPGLVESGFVRPRQRLPGWVIALCILLAVNLVVLLFVLTRSLTGAPRESADQAHRGGTPTPSGGPAPMAAAPATAPATTPADAHFSPLDAPVYAPEIPVPADPPAAAASTTPAVRPPATSANARPHVRHRDPVLNDQDYKPEDEEILPSINQINLGSQGLPELHLDVHVYATKAAERFVFINMRKYHEGATLEEGPIVERIRRDGVVLNYQGVRFLLPRQ